MEAKWGRSGTSALPLAVAPWCCLSLGVANDTEENLSRKLSGDHKLSVTVEGDKEQVLRTIQSIDGIDSVVLDAEHKNNVCDYRIEAKEGMDIRRELFRKIAEKGWYILELKSSELSLEDIFLKLTMGGNVPALENNEEEN